MKKLLLRLREAALADPETVWFDTVSSADIEAAESFLGFDLPKLLTKSYIHIGNGATLAAMAGVMNDVPEKATVVGAPAEDLRDFFVKQANLAKLPDMRKQLKQLEKTVAELQHRLRHAAIKQLEIGVLRQGEAHRFRVARAAARPLVRHGRGVGRGGLRGGGGHRSSEGGGPLI